VPDAIRITVEQLRKRMEAREDFVLVDVRTPQAWAQSDLMLGQAIRFPLAQLGKNLPEIPTNKLVVVYCTCPYEQSSASLAQRLWQRGYHNVRTLQGGLDAWLNAGLPTNPKSEKISNSEQSCNSKRDTLSAELDAG
jgi:rhodanese-related sulfurtransferase